MNQSSTSTHFCLAEVTSLISQWPSLYETTGDIKDLNTLIASRIQISDLIETAIRQHAERSSAA